MGPEHTCSTSLSPTFVSPWLRGRSSGTRPAHGRCLSAGTRARRDEVPFFLTVLFFLASYLTLGVMFWPYMVPYSITVANAAAPEASLGFIFYGGVIVLPVIATYSAGVYYVFRGKTRKTAA